ncbi:nuclear receptor subfamily 2 group F member 5-like [Watersipora subatra]|uniref:nuclear receptor subfamily 2 group F member 5-like n=1 Tax=Watersipora subatra TaxID=2589382 RepID=UPI00355C3C9D
MADSDLVCKVCGDRATGIHYGVRSCHGCRAFFKRSVRSETPYVCKGTRNCVVDMARRNLCKYCRFEKCKRLNMNQEAVRPARQNSSEQTSHSSSSEGQSSQLSRSNNSENSTFWMSLLHANISWIKQIPAINALSSRDKVILVERSWCPIMTIAVAQMSLSIDVDIIMNSYTPSDENDRRAVLSELRKMSQCVNSLRELSLGLHGYAAIKSLCLFTSGTAELEGNQSITNLIQMAREMVLENIDQFPANRCLELLPNIQSVAPEPIERLLLTNIDAAKTAISETFLAAQEGE